MHRMGRPILLGTQHVERDALLAGTLLRGEKLSPKDSGAGLPILVMSGKILRHCSDPCSPANRQRPSPFTCIHSAPSFLF